MRAIKILFCYILVLAAIGCSSKYGVYKSYAFSRKMIAGTIPVDHNNNPLSSGVQKAYLVYMQINASAMKPAWDTAWINGNTYLIEPIKILSDTIYLGQTKTEEQDVIIRAEQNNSLWQLMLNPLKAALDKAMDDEKSTMPIILSGLWKNKRVSYKIESKTELATVFGQ